MYTTMANGHTLRSYLDYLPDVLAMAEQANFAAAKALHQKRMKGVCYSIKAHYLWENFEQFFPSSLPQQCWSCEETISPEFDMSRRMGLCDLKERLAEEAFDGLLVHESFYSYSYPYTTRSSYTRHLV